MNRRQEKIIEGLGAAYPDARCALHFANPLQLLVATILSAQSTDKRVNMVTPSLFLKYPTARSLARSRPEALEKMIHSTGFFRNKARHIREASAIIDRDYGGKVPDDMEALLELPGVARKTANVVLGVAFGKARGVVVDTHVQRVARRLGFTRESRPEKIEQDLMKIVPRERWIDFSHLLIHHGRAVCKARRPECSRCAIVTLCESEDRTV